MVNRRKQTSVSTEQPVRFYKFIALTFLFLTIILLGVIMFMSSKRADIMIESKATPVDITDSILVGNGDRAGSLKGKVATVLVTLEELYNPTGTKEEEAQAKGIATLHNDSNQSQPLVATTRLLTQDGVLFRIKDKVTVPANGSIDVEVYADKKGQDGNIEPSTFTIPGLAEAKQEVIYATSAQAMEGGIRKIGIISVENMKKAKESLSLLLKERGETELSFENPGMEGAFSIIQENIDSSAEIGDEVSEFTLSGKATVLGVFYEKDELQGLVEKSLARRAISDIEFIQPSAGEPTVSIENYDLEKGAATLQVFYDGLAVLDPESKQLEKSMFFGKTKDEVRRYLLKLDHIRSVDVKFSPRWIRTVPYVGEHVNVIIKEVE